MNTRPHTISELQAILYHMNYYKLDQGFIGLHTEGAQPAFYTEKPTTFEMFSWEPVTREDVLKMIDEAGKEKHLSYKELNAERTQGEWKISDDGSRITAGDKLVQLPVITNSEKTESIVNAMYTVLAVNNLHHLAEALEGMIKQFKNDHPSINQNYSLYPSYMRAKEALSKIS